MVVVELSLRLPAMQRLPDCVIALLRCPRTGAPLAWERASALATDKEESVEPLALVSLGPGPRFRYPVLEGIPLLRPDDAEPIDEALPEESAG